MFMILTTQRTNIYTAEPLQRIEIRQTFVLLRHHRRDGSIRGEKQTPFLTLPDADDFLRDNKPGTERCRNFTAGDLFAPGGSFGE
jgi:hypothetical protein